MTAQIQTISHTVDEMNRHMIEIESTQKMCQALLKTPHYAKLGQDGIFAVVSKARSLGMDLIEALNGGLYYVQGKVGMPAESMAALIRQKGHSIIKDQKSNDQVCVLHGKRADNGDTWTCSFSLEDARRAGLLKNSYEKYPSAMLYNRAMSFLARQLFPDVIRGAGYTLDELKEIATNSFTPTENMTHNIKTEEPNCISQEQVDELREIFDRCDPLYYAQVMTHLKKLSENIESLEQIPAPLFQRLKNAALKKANENKKDELEEIQAEVINA